MLAHGAVLRKNGFSSEQLEAISQDYYHAGLPEKDVAIMDYARQVVSDASSTTSADFDRLRSLGCSDEDILGITLTAAARSFMSKVLDALNADPDLRYKDLNEET